MNSNPAFPSPLPLPRLSRDLQPPANGTGAAGWQLNNITLPEGPVQRMLDALMELVSQHACMHTCICAVRIVKLGLILHAGCSHGAASQHCGAGCGACLLLHAQDMPRSMCMHVQTLEGMLELLIRHASHSMHFRHPSSCLIAIQSCPHSTLLPPAFHVPLSARSTPLMCPRR